MAGAVLGEVQVSLCVVGAVLGEVQVSLCVVGAVLGEIQVSLCVVGAGLGEVQVLLCVVGAVLGEVQVSLCVVGAVLGEVQVLLCVVGAVLGEIWKDSLSSKCCIFQYKMLVRSAKSNLCCVAGCGLTGTVSERARNGLGSCSDRPRIGNDVSAVFRKFLPDVGWSFCVAGAVFGEFGG